MSQPLGVPLPTATSPLGIGNREWGIVGMGNDVAGGSGGEKKAVGCGVGRSSSPIPHSRLPIPKGGVAAGRQRAAYRIISATPATSRSTSASVV